MKITKTKFWLAALIIVGLTFWFGHFYTARQKPVEKKLVPVEVETVTTSSIEQIIELTGWIKASQVVDIASKVNGRLESLAVVSDDGRTVPVEEGLAVKKGQLIAVIDHDVYLAQLAAAKASYEASKVQLADALREKERMMKLFESGSTTAQARDKAVTTAEVAEASLNTAKANLELAMVNLRESEIVSPIDGVITGKYIDQGNMINMGGKIVRVADVEAVKIIGSVSEKEAGLIAAGTPAIITVDALPGQRFETKVYSVYPALDELTHTIQIEIRLDNEQMKLKPGMFASISLVTSRKENTVVIPRDVILGGKVDKPYVYVVEKNSDQLKANKRFVEIGITQADRYEIQKGLETGETIVVNGMEYLADGIGVEVVRLGDIK